MLLAAAYPKAALYASDADAEMLRLAQEKPAKKSQNIARETLAKIPFKDRGPFAFILFRPGYLIGAL
jgi:trans-aconitate methyltransferase